MSNKVFVGNLPWSIDTDGLTKLFEEVGSISDSIVLTDRATGRSRGFGFVTFESDEEAQKAIEEFDGKEVEGRNIVVNIAKEREE